jgi:CheY-like chemotaxis protein
MKTILVVEDDDIMRMLLTDLLRQETLYFPIVVGAGSQAIAMTSDIIPDLFLLDYLLPDTNGIELYDRLHERNELASVPAILLTAHMIRSDLQQAIKQRQLEALEKPFDIERLLTMIEQGVRSQSSDIC